MSAPPFLQSAGRGGLPFWGGEQGPTVVIWESLSEQEKESWWKEASTIHDWVMWCKSKRGGGNPQVKKGGRKSTHLSSLGKKSFWTMMKRNRKWRRTKKTAAIRRCIAGRAYDIGQGGKQRQHSNGSEWGSRFMLGSQRSHSHDKTNWGLVDGSEGVGRKGQMSSTTNRYRAGILDGHRDRQIRRLRLPNAKRKDPARTVRGLVVFVLALRGTPVTKPMIHLCDNQALLKAVKKWVHEGRQNL